jgi:hypothetical protein
MKKTIMMALLALTLSACGERRPEPGEQPMPIVSESRVRVERIATFRDDVAYNHERGVYVIKDMKTGQEFIGVSGIGISETGSHQSGKTTARDER